MYDSLDTGLKDGGLKGLKGSNMFAQMLNAKGGDRLNFED